MGPSLFQRRAHGALRFHNYGMRFPLRKTVNSASIINHNFFLKFSTDQHIYFFNLLKNIYQIFDRNHHGTDAINLLDMVEL